MSQQPESTDPRYTLRIFRCDASADDAPRFDNFAVEMSQGATVLDALFRVQEELDPSLSFRFACRGAICGSCAMVINGQLDLACRVQLAQLGTATVVLEPLPNLTVIRDLVVDMDPFWAAFESVRPWLHATVERRERENPMSPEERERIDQYVNCILCACCYASCPVPGREGGYLGPAAIARLARFVEDARDCRPNDALDAIDSSEGAWGCDLVFRCRDACPKEVRPSDGVATLRRRVVKSRLSRPFRSSARPSEDETT